MYKALYGPIRTYKALKAIWSLTGSLRSLMGPLWVWYCMVEEIKVSQPAMFVASMAALEVFRLRWEQATGRALPDIAEIRAGQVTSAALPNVWNATANHFRTANACLMAAQVDGRLAAWHTGYL